MPNGGQHFMGVAHSRIVVCKEHWRLLCSLSWQYGAPAFSNEKELKRLPVWLRRVELPFLSGIGVEGYAFGSHYLYKFVWKSGDITDHLDVYRARR